MIRFLEIQIGDGCGCSRCGASPDSLRPSSEICTDLATAETAENVALFGADALSHEGLDEFLSAARSAGAQRICVEVGAESLLQGAGRLLDAGVRQLRVRLDGPVRDSVAAFRQAASDRDARVSVVGVLDLCRHNTQASPSAVMEASAAGADSVLLRVADPDLDVEREAPWLQAACDTGMVNALWVELEGVPFCFMKGYELHLANVVRSYEGCKPDTCGSCAADPWCDGLIADASEKALSVIRMRDDHEIVAGRLRRTREPVSL